MREMKIKDDAREAVSLSVLAERNSSDSHLADHTCLQSGQRPVVVDRFLCFFPVHPCESLDSKNDLTSVPSLYTKTYAASVVLLFVWPEVPTAMSEGVRGLYCFHHQDEDGGSASFSNVGKLTPVYTALQPSRQQSSSDSLYSHQTTKPLRLLQGVYGASTSNCWSRSDIVFDDSRLKCIAPAAEQ
jgi:hypothetical protein